MCVMAKQFPYTVYLKTLAKLNHKSSTKMLYPIMLFPVLLIKILSVMMIFSNVTKRTMTVNKTSNGNVNNTLPSEPA